MTLSEGLAVIFPSVIPGPKMLVVHNINALLTFVRVLKRLESI